MQYNRFLHLFQSKGSNKCDDIEEKSELLGQFTRGYAHVVVMGYLWLILKQSTRQHWKNYIRDLVIPR